MIIREKRNKNRNLLVDGNGILNKKPAVVVRHVYPDLSGAAFWL